MRKINTNYTNSHSNNHSQFYNAFDKEFSTILDPRPIGNDTYKSYIKNELTETAVRRFVSNSEKRLLILKGPQGSGKSSTLFALHREFNKRKTYTSAVIDLLTCISAIPEDFSKIKDLDRQVASCVPSARRLITSSMQRKTDRLLEEENLKDSDIICDVFRYIYDYHNHVVPSSIALKKYREMEDSVLYDRLNVELERDHKFQAAFSFLKYLYCQAKYRRKKRLIIILDNADHLPYAFIEAAVLIANQFSGIISASNSRQKKIRMS